MTDADPTPADIEVARLGAGMLLAAADGDHAALHTLLCGHPPQVVHAVAAWLAYEVVTCWPDDHDHRGCIAAFALELAEQPAVHDRDR